MGFSLSVQFPEMMSGLVCTKSLRPWWQREAPRAVLESGSVQGLFLVAVGKEEDGVQPRKLLGVAAFGVWEAELPQLSKGELTVIESLGGGGVECCSHSDNDKLKAPMGRQRSLIQFTTQGGTLAAST